ncbi:MAG: DNA translocase FtsK [Solirubrobacterales bacterium]|nr:DNA translocase FtsK [Solirubrobacterales bacterium]HMT04954.1 DNA translocase FtsK [Solirubrobacterales bacterium]
MFVRSVRRGSDRRPSRGASKKPTKAKAAAREPLRQHHLDLIGLGSVLLGIYLVFVLYFGWNGGRLGSGISDGLMYTLGLVAYLVPVALFAAGAVAIFRPAMPVTRPLRLGSALLLAGLLLAFAGGTVGLGGGRPDRIADFDPGWFPEHGGVIGESFYWAFSSLLQAFGAHLIAAFSILGGILLLTGTTVAAVLGRSGNAIRKAGVTSAEKTRTFARTAILHDQKASPEEAETILDPVTPGEEPTVTIGSLDDTDEMELPAAPKPAASPFEVDIWAEEGDEPTVSDRTERLEPIDIFGEGAQAQVGGVGTVVAEPGVNDGSGGNRDDSGDEGIFSDDFEEELRQLEDEFDEPEIEDPGSGSEPVAAEAPVDGKEEQLALTPMGEKRGATLSEEINYKPPPVKVLERGQKGGGPDPAEQKELARKLVETLGHFGVEAKVVGVVTGPHVSRFELQLAPGTKVKKVSELANDLAYALASTDIRILAPIPGKQAVGVEVPNSSRNMVRLGDIYGKPKEKDSPLLAWLGKGIDGKAVSTDLSKMPHVLVAGTTGSGKSGCVNAVLSSILMRSSPNEVRLVLVDPKQVELNHYETVPHLLTPVVTNPKLAANVLNNLIAEMETRYGLMKEARARNIEDYNKAMTAEGEPRLPYILCVIDELADLMMVAPADVESSIIRLAQKSRATGIHLLLATQRPSTDIITGTIKVNIPSRIAFAVSSQTDSRVILDQGGAESLLGQGDMLFRGPGTSKLARIQGAFVSEDEIARITDFWSAQGEPEFEQELLNEPETVQEGSSDSDFDPDQDDLLTEAIMLVVETETASVSMIQRRLRVGYTRAGRLVDMLERRGVISGYEGSKPRQVLITHADLPRILGGADASDDDGSADEDGTGADGA